MNLMISKFKQKQPLSKNKDQLCNIYIRLHIQYQK